MVQPSDRFLAAIVSLDLHGYSRLTERDEIGTHCALMACFRTQLEPAVRDHKGIIVKSTGDGALIHFPKASLAVDAMIHFQECVAVSEEPIPPARRLVFRIGIHVTLAFQDDGDLYGHGVNLAVRLQEIAKPGSILMSEAVAHRLGSEVLPRMEKLGRRSLKNIEERVKIYRLSSSACVPDRKVPYTSGLSSAMFLVCMFLPTATIHETDGTPTSSENALRSNEIKSTYQTEALSELPIGVPTIRWPEGQSVVKTALPEFQESWSVTYRDLLAESSDNFEVVSTMAAAERSIEHRGEIADDAYLQAVALYNRHTPKAFAEAISELEKALFLKPGYKAAHAILAAIYWSGQQNRWQLGLGLTQASMLKSAEKHLTLAVEHDPLVHMVRSEMSTAVGQHDRAIYLAELVIAQDSQHAVGHYAKGRALIFAGRAKEAEASIRNAIRLNPHSSRYLFGLALSQFNTNKFNAAQHTLARAIIRNDDDDWLYLLMAATLGHLGLGLEARQAISRFNQLSVARRGWFASQIPHVHRWPFRNRSDQNRLHLGMLLAGIPDFRR